MWFYFLFLRIKNKPNKKTHQKPTPFTENEAVPHQEKVGYDVMLKFENNSPKNVVPVLTFEYG